MAIMRKEQVFLLMMLNFLIMGGCRNEAMAPLPPDQMSKVKFDSIRTGIKAPPHVDGSMNIYARIYNGSDYYITRIQLRIATDKGERDFNMFVMVAPLSAGKGKIENCYPKQPLRYSIVNVFGGKKDPRRKKS